MIEVSPYEAVGRLHLRCAEAVATVAEVSRLRRELADANETIAMLRELVAGYEDAPAIGETRRGGVDVDTSAWSTSQRALFSVLARAWPEMTSHDDMLTAIGAAGKHGLDNRIKEIDRRLCGTGWRVERLYNAGARLVQDVAREDMTPEKALSAAQGAVWRVLQGNRLSARQIAEIAGGETADAKRRGRQIVKLMRERLAPLGVGIEFDRDAGVYFAAAETIGAQGLGDD